MIALPKLLRRREAERRRVDAFVAAIRATAPAPLRPMPTFIPEPRVELVDGAWQLDGPSRARLVERDDTLELPRIVALASAPLR